MGFLYHLILNVFQIKSRCKRYTRWIKWVPLIGTYLHLLFQQKAIHYLSDDYVIERPVCTTSIDQPNRFWSVFIKCATASGFMHHLNQSSTHFFFNLFWKQLFRKRNWLCLSPEHPANEFHSCETELRNRNNFFGPIELCKWRIQ